jgi:transposase-like protein
VTEFSEAFKSKMVQRMMGPRAASASALSAELGISQPTLSRWLRQAQARVPAMSTPVPPKPAPIVPTPAVVSAKPGPTAKPRRPEDWSAEERLRAVVEASRLSDAELGAFLRSEGLHEATLREWRASALEGLGPQRSGRPEQKRIRELEKQLRRKDKALAEAAALLVLQKKVQAIWGDEDDDTEPRSDA